MDTLVISPYDLKYTLTCLEDNPNADEWNRNAGEESPLLTLHGT